jgi:hypothetical protein
MAIDPISLGIQAAAAIPKGLIGANQWIQANKALKALDEQPVPEYSQGPELTQAYQQAQAMARRGYSATEKGAFQQQLARSQAAQQRSALDLSGGGMGAAINSVLQANQTGAINQFAAQDAALQRQNMSYAGGLAQAIQAQQNLQQQQKIARRTMLEEAYGAAKSQGMENVANMFGSVATSAQAMAGGSGKKTPNTEQPPVLTEKQRLENLYQAYED